jgi:hypothetical protein
MMEKYTERRLEIRMHILRVIGLHNVVLAHMHSMGKGSDTSVAASF